MKIGFIGAGKIGFSLGKYMKEGGVQVAGYYSRHTDSAKEAARFTDTAYYEDIYMLIKDSDALFITVPDGSIPQVFDGIKHAVNNKIICHCSGALTAAEAFAKEEKWGFFGYSIHPLFAVSNKYDSYRELPGVFFALEGNKKYLNEMKAMLESLGNPVAVIPAEKKRKYHLAAALASNYVISLVSWSLDLMGECGFTEKEALAALKPILIGNMEHLAECGPVESLTGPVERNDISTIEKHLGQLEEEDRLLYSLLSKKLLKTAKKKHEECDYRRLRELLKGKSEAQQKGE